MTRRLTVLLVFLPIAVGSAPAKAQSPSGNAKISVLVYYDMEGLAGQEDWRTAAFGHPEEYAGGRELLIADVNAVVDGLLAGGAQVVRVVDGHGSGNSEGPDLPADRLDRRAETIFADRPIGGVLSLVERGTYDGVVLVAMHSKTGRPGFMAHTFNLGIQVQLNGHWITESEGFAYAWGSVGVPVIFVSGDDKLEEDLSTMPWIEYVQVKKSIDSHRALARPVEEARRDLREAAARAVRNLGKMRPMRLATPIKVRVRAVPPASLAAAERVPGLTYADSGVSFTAADLRSAFEGMGGLIGLAGGSGAVWPAVIGTLPNAAQLRAALTDSVVTRAFDYNSGRWKTPVRPERARRYHGSN